jgi:hypothetical protein
MSAMTSAIVTGGADSCDASSLFQDRLIERFDGFLQRKIDGEAAMPAK